MTWLYESKNDFYQQKEEIDSVKCTCLKLAFWASLSIKNAKIESFVAHISSFKLSFHHFYDFYCQRKQQLFVRRRLGDFHGCIPMKENGRVAENAN